MSCQGLSLQALSLSLAWKHLKILTGQNLLHRWLNVSEPSRRLDRRRLRFSEIKFNMQYKSKLRNCQADALSSLQTNEEAQTSNGKLEIFMYGAADVDN